MCKWKRSGWKFSSNAPEDSGFLVGVEKTFWESVSMVNVVTQAEKVIFTWMLIRFSWSVCSPLNSCTSVGDVLVVEEKETSPRVCSQHTHVCFFFFFRAEKPPKQSVWDNICLQETKKIENTTETVWYRSWSNAWSTFFWKK